MKYIILFDGDCGICNKTQMWIRAKDRKNKFEIHPYQFYDYSKFGLNENNVSNSVYVIKESEKYNRSRAVFEILKELPGFYGIIGSILSNRLFEILCNPVYKIIAKNRAKISSMLGLNACKI